MLTDLMRQFAMLRRIHTIQSSAGHCHCTAADVQRATMRRGIDTQGHAAGNGHARLRQSARELLCGFASAGTGLAAADNGDLRLAQHRNIANDIEQQGSIAQLTQQRWILRILPGQDMVLWLLQPRLPDDTLLPAVPLWCRIMPGRARG